MAPHSDDDDSSQCSDSSFDPDSIARAFAKNFAQIEPTERNPSMYSKPQERPSMLQRLSGAGRRPSCGDGNRRKSLFGRQERESKVRHKKRISTIARVKAYFKKEVKFDKKTHVRLIETTEELDVAAIWFTETELRDFKHGAQDIADALDRGIRDEDECYRGLEARTEDGNWNAYKARKDATNAVLDEQDRQLEDCAIEELDLAEIAQVCLEVTADFLEAAQERAKQDALEAEILLKDTKEEYENWKKKQELKANLSEVPNLVEEETVETCQESETASSDIVKRKCSRGHHNAKKQRQGSKTKPLLVAESLSAPKSPRAGRKSWFIRATQKFDQGANTQMLPGVGITTVKAQ